LIDPSIKLDTVSGQIRGCYKFKVVNLLPSQMQNGPSWL